MKKSSIDIPVSKRILFEDNHLLAVNKLPGELVQGDYTGDIPLVEKVKKYIKEEYNKPGNVFCGLIHRLDRPTSGIVWFAKTSKALSRMNAVFEKRELTKKYYAVTGVQPQPTSGTLSHYLKKNSAKNKSFVVKSAQNGAKKALLDYQLVHRSQRYFLIEVDLKTGRHHQIRVQMATIDCPIKGDLKYGFDRSNIDASISLHAGHTEFLHPVKNESVVVRCPSLSKEKIWDVFNPIVMGN